MRLVTALVVLIPFSNCLKRENKKNGRQIPVTSPAATVAINYDSCKEVISLTKQNIKARWPALPRDEKERIFTHGVTETIIPAWLGTPWDFNGTTEKPGVGAIACGYFVTTVLRDAGLRLARVKLAQCASENMIMSLVQPGYITRFSQANMKDFMESIKLQGFGLYIVGLDNHTGFIYNNGYDIYFIHSTFMGTRNVQKEMAVNSLILENSRYRILGKVSSDEKVLGRWIH